MSGLFCCESLGDGGQFGWEIHWAYEAGFACLGSSWKGRVQEHLCENWGRLTPEADSGLPDRSVSWRLWEANKCLMLAGTVPV